MTAINRHWSPNLGEAKVAYFLLQRHGQPSKHMFRKDLFSSISSALCEARKRTALDDSGDFLIEDSCGRIVLNDLEVARAAVEG